MIAVDTNVIIRLLVGDTPVQQRAVLARLEKARGGGEGVFVGAVVLAEVAWVLSAAYGYDRTQIVSALRGVLATPPFVVAERHAVIAALAQYEAGRADFADYLILALSRAESCTTLLTFDRRLLKTAGCEAP